MLVRVKEDKVEIEGYVNAIERNSKTLRDRVGEFIERICKGAFKKALKRNDDVHILLNHDWNRDLGSTKEGNLELEEDNIGLKARATITDKEVVDKARKGDLVGWSFGFTDRDVERSIENGLMHRAVKDLDLYEVSILDRRKSPAYEGTLISARDDKEIFVGDEFIDDIEIREEKVEEPKAEETKEEPKVEQPQVEEPKEQGEPKQQEVVENINNTTEKSIDYSEYENIIMEMKGEC